MSANQDEQNMMGICVGMIIMVSFFFLGFILFFGALGSDGFGIVTILLFMMGVPGIGCAIGIPIIIKSSPSMGQRFMFTAQPRTRVEKDYIHEIPDTCKNCKASISTEDVDWVGPLSAKCPYCGATIQTERRRV